MMRCYLSTALLLALSSPLAAQEAEPVTPASIVAAASPKEWLRIAPEDLLVMDLAPDTQGRARQVVIQLLPAPFSQPWVANVRTLAAAHWWDGTSVYRVVDNWVAQWGDVSEQRALPEGVVAPMSSFYAEQGGALGAMLSAIDSSQFNDDVPTQVAYYPNCDPRFVAPVEPDVPTVTCKLIFDGFEFVGGQFAPFEAIDFGWPIASNYDEVWPIHCYATIGVARDLAPDTGTGAELYAVIGHAPRQLDRNIAIVGRVISGIEHLSTLPRGTGEAGVYADRAEDTAIESVRLASELPDPPYFEYLSTDSESFARYVEVRANRNDAFYTVPAGGVDICNVQVPIRPVAL